MSGSQDDDRRDRELWRRFSDASGEPAQEGAVDPNVLAAYLDGTARPEEVEAVERAMTTDASLVDAVAELREALGGERTAVPPSARTRIEAALSAEADKVAGRLAAAVLRTKTPWYVGIVAAAAVLLISLLGFGIGRYGAADGIDETEAMSHELAPELQYSDAESSLVAALERAED